MLKVSFLRNIFLLSVLIAFSLPVYEIFFIHPSYRTMLIEQTEQEAVRYGNYLIRNLELDKQPLSLDNVPPDLAREVGVIRKDRLLIKLRVFSSRGEIIYSTEESELGVVNQKDYFINTVAKGDYFSKLVKKDALTADGQPSKIDVVETYVPIMAADSFQGAIEVYYDISPALASLESLTKRSNGVLVVIALSLLAAIVVALSRAFTSYREQVSAEKKLVQAKEDLEEKVLARTQDLIKINTKLQSEITEHLSTTRELQKTNEFNRSIINSMSDAVAIIDVKTFEVIDYNVVFQESLEDETSRIVGETCYKLTHGKDAPCTLPYLQCPLHETLETGEAARSVHLHKGKEGKEVYVEVTTSPIRDEQGQVTQVVHVSRDVTERKLAEDEIKQMAYYDGLSGLPNRRMLLDRLQKAIPLAQRKQGNLALLFLDLDRFKEINDTRGHSCGDEILKAVAARLKKIVRGSDTLARLGGDEFVFLLTQFDSELDPGIVAEKILDTIREPFRIADSQVHVTTSIGISIFPNDGEDSEVLLKRADMALYAAKSKGRNTFKFFSNKMNTLVQERQNLESRMHRALEDGEFFLVYQPLVDLQARRVIAVEALLRWQNAELGSIPPARFIPVAENTGLIQPLGDWVLATACREAKSWAKICEGLCVAVNISARQFQPPDFVEKVRSILQETGLPPGLLDLEMKESLLMQNVEDNIRILQRLKELGLRLTIDDFGSGYSSLSTLKNIPIDRIKIDQTFVQDILAGENDRAIVETIITIAERLGLEVVAEGVETGEQRGALLELNCHLMQGFFYAEPMSPSELLDYIVRIIPPRAI